MKRSKKFSNEINVISNEVSVLLSEILHRVTNPIESVILFIDIIKPIEKKLQKISFNDLEKTDKVRYQKLAQFFFTPAEKILSIDSINEKYESIKTI